VPFNKSALGEGFPDEQSSDIQLIEFSFKKLNFLSKK